MEENDGVWIVIDQLTGIVGYDTDHLTLARLVTISNSKQLQDWHRTGELCAATHNSSIGTTKQKNAKHFMPPYFAAQLKTQVGGFRLTPDNLMAFGRVFVEGN